MTIQYSNGLKVLAILLSRDGERMRVAVRDSADALEFFQHGSGVWISEDCEPVQIEFAWQGKMRQEVVSDADCVCSHELASRLLHLLFTGDEQTERESLVGLASAPFDSPVTADKVIA
jgi:hypothetical protein